MLIGTSLDLISGLEGFSYDATLDKLGLFSLECWWLRGDVIEVYKITRGIDKIDSQNLSPRVKISNKKGYNFTLYFNTSSILRDYPEYWLTLVNTHWITEACIG